MHDHDPAGAERIPAWKLIHLKRAGALIPDGRLLLICRLLEVAEYDEEEQ